MVSEVISAAQMFVQEKLGLSGTVVSVERADEGWIALVEATLIDPEMRRLAKRDLVATYVLNVNDQLEVHSFSRSGMRERGSIAQ